MVRTLLAVWLVVGVLVAPVLKAQPPVQPAPTYKLGMKAKPLTIETYFKREDELKGFEKDKVYIVEFWSTTCVFCPQVVPKLTKLQDTYKDKLIVIGITSPHLENIAEEDPKKRMDEVIKNFKAHVTAANAKAETKMGYRLAVDRGQTFLDWMVGYQEFGIPSAFIIDQEGNLAYVGNPLMENPVVEKETFEQVVQKIIDKKWDTKKFSEALEAKAKLLTKTVNRLGEVMPGLKEAIDKKDYRKGSDLTTEGVALFTTVKELKNDPLAFLAYNALKVCEIAFKAQQGKPAEARDLQKVLLAEIEKTPDKNVEVMAAVLALNPLNDELRAFLEDAFVTSVFKLLEKQAPNYLKIQKEDQAPKGVVEVFVHFPMASYYVRMNQYDKADAEIKLALKGSNPGMQFPIFDQYKARIEAKAKQIEDAKKK